MTDEIKKRLENEKQGRTHINVTLDPELLEKSKKVLDDWGFTFSRLIDMFMRDFLRSVNGPHDFDDDGTSTKEMSKFHKSRLTKN